MVRVKVVRVHAIKALRGSKGIAPLTLNLGAGRGEWLTSRLSSFTRWTELRYLLNRRLHRPQRWFRRFGVQKNLLTLKGFKPRTI
jgi:hypothetical protein